MGSDSGVPAFESLSISKAKRQRKKIFFLLRNLGLGFLGLATLILAVYWLGDNIEEWFGGFLNFFEDHPILMYLSYAVGEYLNLIPPEPFLFWALRTKDTFFYIQTAFLLAIVSYLVGHAGFLTGRKMRHVKAYRKLLHRFYQRYLKHLRKYGSYLLIASCVTPIPFVVCCALFGSMRYKFSSFATLSLFRFLRFIMEGFIIYYCAEFLEIT
ncbi:MAG: hypothetical protein OXB93_00515 [Cytophagales bacterium]|nr:hypothetical protein [Cytophagales bacterium]